MRPGKLILILGVLFIFFIAGCKKPEAAKVIRVPHQKKISPEQTDNQTAEFLLKELRQKNPFRKDHTVGITIEIKGAFGLRGIIWDAQRPFALIGDSVVSQGDDIDNKKVIKINKDSVILDNAGTEEVLRLE